MFVKAVKDNEAAQKIPTEEEANKNMICKEKNIIKQQHERTENERMKQSTAKGSYAPKDELKKFGRCQRRFFPPMKNITCFSCHKPGHIATHCKTRHIKFNQQKMHQMRRLPQENKWKGQPLTKYINHFHGYCYACNEFGHKSIECKLC